MRRGEGGEAKGGKAKGGKAKGGKTRGGKAGARGKRDLPGCPGRSVARRALEVARVAAAAACGGAAAAGWRRPAGALAGVPGPLTLLLDIVEDGLAGPV